MYTPIAAVLHRAGDQREFKRRKAGAVRARSPSSSRSRRSALLEAVDQLDREFGLLCYVLLLHRTPHQRDIERQAA